MVGMSQLAAEAAHVESHGSVAGTQPTGSLLSFLLLLFRNVSEGWVLTEHT